MGLRAHLPQLILLPLAGWALLQLLGFRGAGNAALWLAGAVVVHDFLLLPAYSALDAVARRAAGGAINHVRVPAALSLLVLAVFWPSISGASDGAFRRASGISHQGYFTRWLLFSAALFAISGALYLVRRTGRDPAT
ncbi:MAG TPA: hypothetical protein VNS09_06940 [Solirubrobacter sp.]|nr:hypothetical protein [Solirubrobacter sp.]